MIQNIINHVAFIVDASGSMDSVEDQVVKVFNSQIAFLAKRSKELNQETRVSVYLFSDSVICLIYDMDVLRLPKLDSYYDVHGSTALIDGALKGIQDLLLTPEIYADHSFLVYVLTDGEENYSHNKPHTLAKAIANLKENWTMAVFVPDQRGVGYAKQFGFPEENIKIWTTTSKGLSDVGRVIQEATEAYMTCRAKGIRGTKNLFSLDVNNLSTTAVKSKLIQLDSTEYELLPVHKETDIKTFVESWTKKPYVKGSSYYLLTKPEKVQPYKQVCVQEKMSGKVYAGTNARNLLNLPNYEVQVAPASHNSYDIYIQSTSLNRRLVGGTKLIVLK